MKTNRLTSPSTHPNIEGLMLGDLIRPHAPICNVTILAARPPEKDNSPYESYMVMPVQHFLDTYKPDHFRIREGGQAMAKNLKSLFLRELGKVW